MESLIFHTKTTEAYYIKILVELLMNNIKVAHFEIDNQGIRLCMMDAHRRILINLNLFSDNFTYYKQEGPSKLYIGINLSHLHRMCRSIKKKDHLELFIEKSNPTKLAIRVIPKDNNRITTSYIIIQSVQELAIDVPTDYGKPVIVSSSEFQKMCKDMSSIGNITNVKAREFNIIFSTETDGLFERTVEFGETNLQNQEISYNQNFVTEQLLRITKIAGLSSKLKIFVGNPLLLKTNVGTLGEISLYIKSKEYIDDDLRTYNSDSD